MCAEWLESISTLVGALATVALAGLAVPNLRALRRYVEDTNEIKRESLRQGVASRRPFVSIVPDKERVWLMNSGPGIAYKTTWQFNQQFGNFVKPEAVGAIGVGIEVPLSYRVDKFRPLTLEDVGNNGGIRIDYEDADNRKYWSTISRTPEGYTVIDTDQV